MSKVQSRATALRRHPVALPHGRSAIQWVTRHVHQEMGPGRTTAEAGTFRNLYFELKHSNFIYYLMLLLDLFDFCTGQLYSILPSSRSSEVHAIPFIHSFIPAISIAPLQVLYYSEALPTTARILYRSFTPKRTGNCR